MAPKKAAKGAVDKDVARAASWKLNKKEQQQVEEAREDGVEQARKRGLEDGEAQAEGDRAAELRSRELKEAKARKAAQRKQEGAGPAASDEAADEEVQAIPAAPAASASSSSVSVPVGGGRVGAPVLSSNKPVNRQQQSVSPNSAAVGGGEYWCYVQEALNTVLTHKTFRGVCNEDALVISSEASESGVQVYTAANRAEKRMITIMQREQNVKDSTCASDTDGR